jgi:hypothetical protein
MKNKILIFLAVFFVMANAIAGGDDRDQGPVESFDSLEVEPVTDNVVVGELEAQTMTLSNTAAEEARLADLEWRAEFEAQLAEQARLEEARLADLEWRAEFEAQLAEQARLEEARLADLAWRAEFEAQLAEQARLEEARLADLEWRAEFEAQLAEQARLAEVIATTSSGVEITVAAHESCQNTLGLTDYNIDKFITSVASGRLYNEGPQLDLGTAFTSSRWDQYFDCVDELSK